MKKFSEQLSDKDYHKTVARCMTGDCTFKESAPLSMSTITDNRWIIYDLTTVRVQVGMLIKVISQSQNFNCRRVGSPQLNAPYRHCRFHKGTVLTEVTTDPYFQLNKLTQFHRSFKNFVSH